MPAVNDVGEPCAGEPHARFDGRQLETEQIGQGHRSGTTRRETAGTKASGSTAKHSHRASSRPYNLAEVAIRGGLLVLLADAVQRGPTEKRPVGTGVPLIRTQTRLSPGFRSSQRMLAIRPALLEDTIATRTTAVQP